MTAVGIVVAVFATFMGLAIGSFMCVVIDRLPKALDEPNEFGEVWDTTPWPEVLGGHSRCSSCGTAVRPIENVPVLAWLVLRGRCRTCGESIGAFHPLVEAAVPAVGWLAYLVLGSTPGLSNWRLAPVLWLIPVGIAIAVIDSRTLIVPTRLVWPSFWVSVAITTAVALGEGHPRWLLGALVGLVTYAGPLAILWFLLPKAMGFGDVRLTVLLGWTLGFIGATHTDRLGLVVVLGLIAMVVASVLGIVMGIAWKVGLGRPMPFGPGLVIAALACSIFVERVLDPFMA